MKNYVREVDKELKKVLDRKEIYLIVPVLEKGAKSDVMNEEGNAPIHLAVLNDNLHVLKYLIEKKADLNLVNPYTKRSALMMAVQGQDEKMANVLINAGANLNLQDSYNETALHVAVRYANEPITDLLIKRGANLDIQNNKGWTALMIAIRRANKKLVSALIENGANIHLTDKNGWSALTWAVDLGHGSFAKSLIEKGADINIQDSKGRTPLMRAVKNDYTEAVFALLMKDADIDVKDVYGKTAMDYAVERGFQECIKLLSLVKKREEKKAVAKEVEQDNSLEIKDVFSTEKGAVLATLSKQVPNQIFKVKTDGKKLYLTPVSLKKSEVLKKVLKDVLLFGLKREKD
ncbi:MAG: ankyrin repeat domain-containing protein [Alphaproteobacteria bacterium]|nr:ankyrin repeat domain-containing protein [Alphaproteobacteria bacterium]